MADRQLRLADQVVRTLGGPRLASLGGGWSVTVVAT